VDDNRLEIDWPAAIDAAGRRLHVRLKPLLQGALLEAHLVDHPTLTPGVRLAGSALIALHELIDPTRGVLEAEIEALPELARTRRLRAAACAPPDPDPAREPDAGRFYARALTELLQAVFRARGFEYIVKMGDQPPLANEWED
jgi:hypothetical protein